MHYKPRSKKISGVIIISKSNTILLVKGRKMNKWSFPKGHIKGNETILQCAMRECYEETGICLDDYNYDSHKKLSSGEYFIFRDVDELETNIQDSCEICDIAWLSIPSMMNLRSNIDVNAFLSYHTNIVVNND